MTIEIETILDNIDLVRAERLLSEYANNERYRNSSFPYLTIQEIFEEYDSDETELRYLISLDDKYGIENLKTLI